MITTRQALSLRGEAKAIVEEWHRGAPPDAQAALARRPELRGVKSLVEDLAYEEYCLRCDAGEALDLDAFCDRFPTFRASIHRMLANHRSMANYAPLLAEAPAVRWPEPGERLADLMVLRELGRGGFARVYLALEESTGARPVAVKFSPEGDAEARTMGRLAHPNIVPVLSARFEETVGLTAVCMPFLGAATLIDLLDGAYPTPDAAPPREAAVIHEAIRSAARSDDPPPSVVAWSETMPQPGNRSLTVAARTIEDGLYADAVARIAWQLADALAFLHKEGVVHRDLKPSNVLLRPDGQALLLDFNLSADARAAGPRLGGTLPYMAPEQLRALLQLEAGEALDGRMDLFALGVMLYELLTGKHPFGAPPAGQPPAEAGPALLERQRRGCPPLRILNPAVDGDLAGLIERCLAFDPAGRPASAADLAVGLRRHLAAPARLRRWAARRPLVAAAAAGLLLLAVGGTASEIAPQPTADVRDYNRGRADYFDGDYDRAEEYFNQAVQDCPTDPRPRKYYLARAAAAMRRGEASGDNGQFATAIVDLREALKQQSDGATLALTGYCTSQTGYNSEAILWYDRAVKAGFESAGLYNDRGFDCLQLHKLDEAAQDFGLALRLDPTLQPAVVNQAKLLLGRRSTVNSPPLPDSLMTQMKQAVETGPGSQELYLTGARVFATAAHERQPGDPKVFTALALVCVQKAVDCGVDPQQAARIKAVSAVLQPLKEYQTLLDTPPRPAGPVPQRPLIDPAPYHPE